MAKTHTVKSGDTLGKISVRYYGYFSKWADIVKANPQLSGRKTASDGSPLIFPGDILIIPENERATATSAEPAKTVVLDEDAKQDMSLIIDGKRFTGFTGYTLVQSVKGVDAFSFSAPYDSSKDDLRAAFAPFVYHDCKVYYDGDMVFNGVALAPAVSLSSSSSTLNVQGYAKCGVLIDSCLPESLFPAEYNGLNLKQIAETVCAPFGLSVVVDGDIGDVFEKVEIDVGGKVWDFLEKLAEQRGLFLSNTQDGSLLIYKPKTESVSASFKQGEFPLISVTPNFNSQGMYSHITGYSKTTTESDSAKYTWENTFLTKKGVLRCMGKKIEDATEGTLEASVKALAGEMFASCVKYSINVSGHRDKNGRVYRKNMALSLMAPGAEIFKDTKFLVDEVTLKRSDNEGMSASFSLVLPESRDGSLPEVFPWEE